VVTPLESSTCVVELLFDEVERCHGAGFRAVVCVQTGLSHP
jgi:hypothetical protein